MFENPNLQLPVNDDAEYFARKIDYSHENEREVQLDLDMDRVLAERQELERQLLPTKVYMEKINALYEYVEEHSRMPVNEQIEYLTNVLQDLVDTIARKTNIQNQFGSLVDFQQLGDLRKFVEESDNVVIRKFGKSPSFDPVTDKIEFPQSRLKKSVYDLLVTMTSFGIDGMPEAIVEMYHELLHSRQSDQLQEITAFKARAMSRIGGLISRASIVIASYLAVTQIWSDNTLVTVGLFSAIAGISIKALKSVPDFDQVISEVPAHMAEGRMMHRKAGEMQYYDDWLVTGNMIERMKDYGEKSPESIDRIISCAQSVNRLHLLGLSHEAIQALVKKAKWDKKRLAYDTLKDEEERLMKENDISPEELDTAVDVDRAKATNLNLQVKVVVHEYIDKLVHVEQV